MDIGEYLAERRKFFETRLGDYLPDGSQYPKTLKDAMEYSLFAGGKRLRPILTLAVAEACGGNITSALAPAAALEMIHTYSLIHDDLPAMDDDELRRGKPTSHKVFGEGMAILAGDALLTHAFSVLAESNQLESGLVLDIISELALAAGPRGMVAGQALDIAGEESKDLAQLHYIHSTKTGALITAAVRIGAITAQADADLIGCLTRYAASLGLAYQIVDDILDVTETSSELGKNPGSDKRKGKQTFAVMFGLEEAQKMADAETQKAVESLAHLDARFHLLQELAIFLGTRHN